MRLLQNKLFVLDQYVMHNVPSMLIVAVTVYTAKILNIGTYMTKKKHRF